MGFKLTISHKGFIAGLLWSVLLLNLSCKKEDSIPQNPTITVAAQEIKDLSYGADSRKTMDVYLPANRSDKTVLVIFVHGGSFIMGDKQDYAGVVQELYRAQLAVVNVNYRLVDDRGLYENPVRRVESAVKVKDQVQDLAQAIDFVRQKAAEWKISTQKVALVGHSAGATLSLLYAYSDQNSDKIKTVVNLAGSLDQTFTDIPNYTQVLPAFVLEAAYRFTGYPVIPENINYFKEISPLYQVNGNKKIPTLTIFPENNDVMGLPKQNRAVFDAFTQALQQQNVPHKFVVIPKANHEFFGYFDLVLKETLEYLKIQFD